MRNLLRPFLITTFTKGTGGAIPSCINMVGHFSIDAARGSSTRNIIIIITYKEEEEEEVVLNFENNIYSHWVLVCLRICLSRCGFWPSLC